MPFFTAKPISCQALRHFCLYNGGRLENTRWRAPVVRISYNRLKNITPPSPLQTLNLANSAGSPTCAEGSPNLSLPAPSMSAVLSLSLIGLSSIPKLLDFRLFSRHLLFSR